VIMQSAMWYVWKKNWICISTTGAQISKLRTLPSVLLTSNEGDFHVHEHSRYTKCMISLFPSSSEINSTSLPEYNTVPIKLNCANFLCVPSYLVIPGINFDVTSVLYPPRIVKSEKQSSA
jgi:hypothetical protein